MEKRARFIIGVYLLISALNTLLMLALILILAWPGWGRVLISGFVFAGTFLTLCLMRGVSLASDPGRRCAP